MSTWILLALAGLPAPAPGDPFASWVDQAAQEPSSAAAPAPAETGGWTFAVRPYLWAASVGGSVTAGNLPAQDFDLSFSDLVDDLEFAWMMGLEARPKDAHWGLLVDSLYMDLEGGEAPLSWEFEQLMLEADITWRVGPDVDLLAGARFWSFQTDVSISPPGLSGSGDESWVDPVIGVRGLTHLSERWALAGRGDIGGFGVGSEFSWQLAGYVLFIPSHTIDLILGYRYLDLDLEEGNLEMDLGFGGPVLGVGINF